MENNEQGLPENKPAEQDQPTELVEPQLVEPQPPKWIGLDAVSLSKTLTVFAGGPGLSLIYAGSFFFGWLLMIVAVAIFAKGFVLGEEHMKELKAYYRAMREFHAKKKAADG